MREPQPEQPKPRVIAIVGRPNVGKSAIFNRIVRRRIAIVHSESGVTRDRVVSTATWDGKRFSVIDTGGLDSTDGSGSDVVRGIRRQVEAALGESSAALLVVDGAAGLHPLDEDVAVFLRRRHCPAVVAVNKADNPERDAVVADFARLGFPVFPVSALHDRGFEPLMDKLLALLPSTTETVAEEEKDENPPLRVAVVGRPNVGKSSFINRLLRDDRVLVSDIPGTTRDSIEIPFQIGEGPTARRYTLIDTAGMRQKHKIDNSVERFSLFRAERSVTRSDVAVLVLDAKQGPTLQDKKIGAFIAECGRGCVVIVNKWDLAESETTQRQYAPALHRAMPFLKHCPLVFQSAKTGYNIRKSIEAIDHVAAQMRTYLSTGQLNRVIEDAVKRVAPPSIGGKRLRIYYAVQTGAAPITIRLFVNYPERMPPAYNDYLERRLREHFGLEGAPLILHPRAHRKEV